MGFIKPLKNSPADPNRHVCNLPSYRQSKRLLIGTRFQCDGCHAIYEWTYPYSAMGGKGWDREY